MASPLDHISSRLLELISLLRDNCSAWTAGLVGAITIGYLFYH